MRAFAFFAGTARLVLGAAYLGGSLQAIAQTTPDLSAAFVDISVTTKTKTGEAVLARVRVRTFPNTGNGDSEPEPNNQSSGVQSIRLARCDPSVLLNAYAQQSLLMRLGQDWKACDPKGVVFSDFERISTELREFSDPAYWGNSFGGTVASIDPSLPQNISSAFAQKDYGKIAIFGTEMSKQMRTAGKIKEADFFYSLAVDAASEGVKAKSLPSQAHDILADYYGLTNRVELTPFGKSQIKVYQKVQLGFDARDPSFGTIDWQTMKSLQGGSKVTAQEFQLPSEAIKAFSFDDLAKAGIQ